MKSFDLVTLCNLVTVSAEAKSVTKSRLHCICEKNRICSFGWLLGSDEQDIAMHIFPFDHLLGLWDKPV